MYDDEEKPCEDCQAAVGSPCFDWCPNGMSPYDPPRIRPSTSAR
ncbi:hypothetical protein [Streptomyces sp. NPDC058268]